MSVGVLGETAAAILAQARILGLLGGAGDLAVGAFEVRRYGRLVRGAGHRGAVVLLLCCVAGSLGAPAGARPAPKREAHLLRAYRPLLRFDRSERELPAGIEALVHSARLVRGSGRVVAASPARGVPALTPEFLGPRYPKGAGRADPDDRIVGTDAGLGRPPKPLVHGRLVRRAQGGAWLQYWLFYRDNPQDRGVLHTGRHQGDWELVQVRLDRRDRPERTTLRAHTWAQGCGRSQVRRTASGTPIVFVANGSHANYSRPGVHDRPWPDPNDHADGRGRALRPPVRPIDDGRPRWVSWPGRFGGSRAAPIPSEQSSPRGPAFQPAWSDPVRLERDARPCTAGPPGRPWQTLALVGLAVVVLLALLARRRRRMRG